MTERLLSSVVGKLAVILMAFKFKPNSLKRGWNVYCFDHCVTLVNNPPMTGSFPFNEHCIFSVLHTFSTLSAHAFAPVQSELIHFVISLSLHWVFFLFFLFVRLGDPQSWNRECACCSNMSVRFN